MGWVRILSRRSRISTGTWALVFLCVTLSMTPLRRLLHQNWLVRLRWMFGLLAFFYGCLHVATYVWLDKPLDFSEMIKDVYKRPFITAGFTAFLLMVSLAVTSTSGMIRRLGGKRWQMLHRLVYVSAITGAIHYYWLVKSDETVPFRFAAVVGTLLVYRLLVSFGGHMNPTRVTASLVRISISEVIPNDAFQVAKHDLGCNFILGAFVRTPPGRRSSSLGTNQHCYAYSRADRAVYF
jgi:methionine sulfoxide reductase heme-binding subunit